MLLSKTGTIVLATILAGGMLVACNDVEGPAGEAGGNAGAGAIDGVGGYVEGTGGLPGTGAVSQTGGAETGGGPNTCEGTARPAEAYRCAGNVYEQQELGFNWAVLQLQPSYYACGQDYYYYDDYGTGGSTDYYPNPGMGGAEGGDEWGGFAGAASTGGVVGVGGDIIGAGGTIGMGGYGGITETGGAGGSATSDWCDGLEGGAIAGVSYSAGPCTESELRLPIHFREPSGWYRLRVFAGNEACERGTLLTETSGYGVGGADVELPISVPSDVFVSLELTTEDYGYGEAAIELVPRREAGQ